MTAPRHGTRFEGGGIDGRRFDATPDPSGKNDRPWVLVKLLPDGVRRAVATFSDLEAAKRSRRVRGWETHAVDRGDQVPTGAVHALDLMPRPLRPPGR